MGAHPPRPTHPGPTHPPDGDVGSLRGIVGCTASTEPGRYLNSVNPEIAAVSLPGGRWVIHSR